MAKKKQDTQMVEDGPEFSFLGNLFGMLIASAGLLAGTMMRERSFDYWLEDIVPLLLFVITFRGVLVSSISLARISIVHDEKMDLLIQEMAKKNIMDAQAGALPDMEIPLLTKKKQDYSEEEVLEAVSRRLQEKKEESMRKNKFAPKV